MDINLFVLNTLNVHFYAVATNPSQLYIVNDSVISNTG